jgi:hypothetical protein
VVERSEVTMDFPHLWMQTICRRRPAEVLRLYAPSAVLIPTYDEGPLVGHRQLAAYFRHFLAKPGLCGLVESCVEQTLGRVEIYSGLYSFRWQGGSARARFSFVVVGGVVVNHHSSEVPA